VGQVVGSASMSSAVTVGAYVIQEILGQKTPWGGIATATVTIGPAVTAGVYLLKSWTDLTVTPTSTELEIRENAASASFEVPAGTDRNFYQLLYTPPPLP